MEITKLEQQTFPESTSGPASFLASAPVTQLHHNQTKAAVSYMETDECGYVPITLRK